MDVFTLAMGLTLLAAGHFMLKDYSRFLSSGYTVKGKVVSLQQAYQYNYSKPLDYSNQSDSSSLTAEETHRSRIFPVIEYRSNRQLVRFTMIDDAISDQPHIGDMLDLRFCRSRRDNNRVGRSTILLITMLAVLTAGLFLGGIFSEMGLTVAHICFASFVLTFCLCLIVAYYRCRDASCKEHDGLGHRNGRMRILISEPSAFNHWASMIDDGRQKRRVRGSQAFGAGCFMSGLVIVATAFLLDANQGAYADSIEQFNQQVERFSLKSFTSL